MTGHGGACPDHDHAGAQALAVDLSSPSRRSVDEFAGELIGRCHQGNDRRGRLTGVRRSGRARALVDRAPCRAAAPSITTTGILAAVVEPDRHGWPPAATPALGCVGRDRRGRGRTTAPSSPRRRSGACGCREVVVAGRDPCHEIRRPFRLNTTSDAVRGMTSRGNDPARRSCDQP
jgi:hypothetical protein